MSRNAVAAAERGGLPLAAPADGHPIAAPATAAAGAAAGSSIGDRSDLSGRAGAITPTSAAPNPAGAGVSRPALPPSREAAAATAVPVFRQGSAPTPQPTPASVSPAAGRAAPPGGPMAPVAVGTVATISGPVGAFVKDSIFAVSVWTKWVNGRGGVNGHPVRHIVVDDGGDPARYNASVRQLVEEQGVVAFLFNTIGFAGGDFSYVSQKRVPIIGHEAGTEDAYSNPMVFTPYPSGLSYAYGLIAGFAQTVVPRGKAKLATIACSDVKLCDLFDRTWNGPAARELGFENVYRARASLTQPDYTAECLSARQAGAQVILGAIDNNSYLRLGHSCARQDYKPIIGVADQLALPSVAADPVMDGDVVITKVAPWPDRDVPGTAVLHQAFAQIAPGVEVNGAHAGGWVTAKTFEAAARNLPDRPTSADVLNGLWSLTGDSLDGMTFPLTFPREQPSPRRSCWGVTLIERGRFVPMADGKLKCKA
jgi:ABC-type branched-subunit amino acid transport system substrate-binding protein